MENSVVTERGWGPSGDEPKEWNSTRKVKEKKKKYLDDSQSVLLGGQALNQLMEIIQSILNHISS